MGLLKPPVVHAGPLFFKGLRERKIPIKCKGLIIVIRYLTRLLKKKALISKNHWKRSVDDLKPIALRCATNVNLP